MSLKKYLAALTSAFLFASSPAALAVVVLQPVGVSVDPLMGTFAGYPESAMIDQLGLTGGSGYVSGVTDYGEYVAPSMGPKPIHNAVVARGTSWRSAPNPSLPGNIDFNLGGMYALTNIALWSGTSEPGFGSLEGFDVWVDVINTFATKTFAGSFTAANQFSPTDVQSFDLASAITGSFVRFVVTSSYDSEAVSIGEVAFGVVSSVSVAEPFTVALLGIGLAGFGLRKRPLH